MSSREPQPRSSHAAVGIGRKLYVWGGKGDPSQTSIQCTTIESFDVLSETWQPPKEVDCPLPSNLISMAVATDGESAYFFGGSPELHTYSNTVYQVEPSTRRGQCWELVPRNPSEAPRKGCGAGMACYNYKLVVYGGFDGKECTNELRVMDLGTKIWSLQPTTGEQPPPLAWHSFTKIDHHRAVVFGGFTGKSMNNDTFVLDMETWRWTKLKPSGPKPCVRFSHAACCIAGPLTEQQHPLVMVVGGRYFDRAMDDVWLLDVDKETWSQVTLPVPIMMRRDHSAVAFGCGPSFRVVVIFGGHKSSHVDDPQAETTLLFLELKGRSWGLGRGSWQVTRVVKSHELGRPEKRLREQMRKLALPSQPEYRVVHVKAHPTNQGSGQQTQSTATYSTASATYSTASPTGQVDTSAPTYTSKARVETRQSTSTDSAAAATSDNSTKHTSAAGAKRSPIIDMSEIQMGKLIGQGGFGAVFEAKWKKKNVAVKVCPGNLLENLSREIQILTSLPPHSHVLTFFGAALSRDSASTYIVTELAPNGSLYDYLHVKKEEPSLDQSFAWTLQVASGMHHLHSNNIVHRDLKSGNILLSFGLLAKVCDFGTARTLAKTTMTSQKGTYRWMAPEVVEDVEANINRMCDVFSFGMVVYEIFACKIPYDDVPSNARVGVAVLQGQRPPIPSSLPPFLQPLLEACWQEEPDKRPQFEAIVAAIQTGSFE